MLLFTIVNNERLRVSFMKVNLDASDDRSAVFYFHECFRDFLANALRTKTNNSSIFWHNLDFY